MHDRVISSWRRRRDPSTTSDDERVEVPAQDLALPA
jgi:hypothetical protein